jgi:hypothetical protein
MNRDQYDTVSTSCDEWDSHFRLFASHFPLVSRGDVPGKTLGSAMVSPPGGFEAGPHLAASGMDDFCVQRSFVTTGFGDALRAVPQLNIVSAGACATDQAPK